VITAAEQPQTFTFEEYLKVESASEVRHEYVGGHLYDLIGGSVGHGLLVQLINTRLLAAFLPKGCRVHSHDTKLRIPDGRTYYPDVYVVCGPEAHPLYDTDAQWVVEVRSPTTAATDDREKSPAYMQLPSLEGYILADPDSRYLELRTPTEVGWQVSRYPDGGVLQAGPAALDVTEIFDQLDALDPA
jgi:Uma2 family endonuclease